MPNLGVLSSPRRFYTNVDGWRWAADNDAFSDWDDVRYMRMLDGLAGIPGCLFVTLPDVVGDAARTLELFHRWLPHVAPYGYPLALVAQDGLDVAGVPWDEISALFVGGTDEFKMGVEALELAREAKRRSLWVHYGRVNGHRRIRWARAAGADSFDGSSLSWFRDRWLVSFADHAAGPPQLLLEEAP